MTPKEENHVRVQWHISADIECPNCGHDDNFMEIDEFWVYSNVGENCESFFAPIEHTCSKCGHDYHINGSDY